VYVHARGKMTQFVGTVVFICYAIRPEHNGRVLFVLLLLLLYYYIVQSYNSIRVLVFRIIPR